MVVQYFITYFILNSNDISIDVSEVRLDYINASIINSFPYCSKTNLILTVDFHYECLRAGVGCEVGDN